MGPYESRVILDDDYNLPGRGVAQGTIVDSEVGDWYAILFQDRGASGRIPYLLPAKWEDDWPVIGVEGRIPDSFETHFQPFDASPLISSDSFDHKENKLGLFWQWNHNPIQDCWSFTQRQGYLRLTTGHIATNIMDARNTLTQRTMEPGSICEVMLDVSGLKEGDYAGLCAFQGRYGQIGVRVKDGERYVETTQKKEDGSILTSSAPLKQDKVYLRVVFDYRQRKDEATFFYSTDKVEWTQLGEILPMIFTLDLFVGYRIGLFCYATKEIGGYADFKDFSIEVM
jgi:beta-xylosidase